MLHFKRTVYEAIKFISFFSTNDYLFEWVDLSSTYTPQKCTTSEAWMVRDRVRVNSYIQIMLDFRNNYARSMPDPNMNMPASTDIDIKPTKNLNVSLELETCVLIDIY